MIFIGVDWAEDHHEVCVLDERGGVLDRFRIGAGLQGVSTFHARVSDHVDDPGQVRVGIETDRGLLVGSLQEAGYQVYAINPFAAACYRSRHSISGATSDKGAAKMLAGLVHTDRHNHRPVAADSELQQAIRVHTRSHQALLRARQRHINWLRNALVEYYPAAVTAFGSDLGHSDAIAVLTKATTPETGWRLTTSQSRAAIKRGGRQRSIDRHALEIRDALRSEQLQAPALVTEAFGVSVAAMVAAITCLTSQITLVEEHLAAEIMLSLPGVSHVLGAQLLAEFGDAPDRYVSAKARRNYASTAPITVASGTSHQVRARHIRNKRLTDACWSGPCRPSERHQAPGPTTRRTTPDHAPGRPQDDAWRTSSSASFTDA